MRMMNGLVRKPFAVVKGAVAGLVASAILAGCSADGLDKYGWDWDPARAAREDEYAQRTYVAPPAQAKAQQAGDDVIVHTGYGMYVAPRTPQVAEQQVAKVQAAPPQPTESSVASAEQRENIQASNKDVLFPMGNGGYAVGRNPDSYKAELDATNLPTSGQVAPDAPFRLADLPASHDQQVDSRWATDMVSETPSQDADLLVSYVNSQPDSDITDAKDNNVAIPAVAAQRRATPAHVAAAKPAQTTAAPEYVPLSNCPALNDTSRQSDVPQAATPVVESADRDQIVLAAPAAPRRNENRRPHDTEIVTPVLPPAAQRYTFVIAERTDNSSEARRSNLPPAARGDTIILSAAPAADASAPTPATQPTTRPAAAKNRDQEFVIIVP